jgi:hypothetical protein
MAEKLFILKMTWAEPGTRSSIQPIRATRVEQDDTYLWFYKMDGSVAGMFEKSLVRSWRESSDEELGRLGREIDARDDAKS